MRIFGLVAFEFAESTGEGFELGLECVLHALKLRGVFVILGEVVLLVGILCEIVKLIAFEVGGVGSRRTFFSVAASGDGGEVTEGLVGIFGDDVEVATTAVFIPFVEDCGAFSEAHCFDVLGVAKCHVFPVANTKGARVSEFKIESAFGNLWRAVEFGKEALSIEILR